MSTTPSNYHRPGNDDFLSTYTRPFRASFPAKAVTGASPATPSLAAAVSALASPTTPRPPLRVPRPSSTSLQPTHSAYNRTTTCAGADRLAR